jgi:chromosome segregation ATPase
MVNNTIPSRKFPIFVFTLLACLVTLASLVPAQGEGQNSDLQTQVKELKKQVEELSKKVDAQSAAYASLRTEVGQRIVAQDQKLVGYDQESKRIGELLTGHQGQLNTHLADINQLDKRLRVHGW